MLPASKPVEGTHIVSSPTRSPKEAGRRYARARFRALVFFGIIGLIALADMILGVSSEAYVAAGVLTIFPLLPTVVA